MSPTPRNKRGNLEKIKRRRRIKVQAKKGRTEEEQRKKMKKERRKGTVVRLGLAGWPFLIVLPCRKSLLLKKKPTNDHLLMAKVLCQIEGDWAEMGNEGLMNECTGRMPVRHQPFSCRVATSDSVPIGRTPKVE
jgi:hypothetical protein